MATELITFKMDGKLLKEVDETARYAGFQNRTEFIRASLREKVDEVKLRKAMLEILPLKGASKKKTTDEEYERIREMAAHELWEKSKFLQALKRG
ncbi:MAG: ribbon-helix-helix domain-containing protein [archaeon]|nr:ribbon-helix-helix domain-containing protein [archaeon]